MKATFVRNYKKLDKNNNLVTVFVYSVSGTEAELDAYKKASGDQHREDDAGKSLWFTTKFAGNSTSLRTSAKGSTYADTSELDQISSLVQQYPGPLGMAIAQIGAQKILGNSFSSAPANQPVVKTEGSESMEQ